MVALQLEGVTKRFGEKTAVDKLAFSVDKGEIFGLIGANGAGKTTTMRMVLGLIYPDEGTIQYNGKSYSKEVKSMFGYLPEERGLYPKIKVSEQLVYLTELRGVNRKEADRRLKKWLERFGVPENYGKRVEELSKGNQQKIQFIAAVIHEPQFLILDEAFSGLDPVNVELLKETISEVRNQGTTILFSSHRMEHIEELCQHICILKNSKAVLQGNLREIKRSFPRERVQLETQTPVSGLESVQGVANVKRLENGYDIAIRDEAAAQRILEAAMKQSAVMRFAVKEPTLHDIFIRTVGGGEHE
jgi:ABC-2 type transport system ATP-binding protein